MAGPEKLDPNVVEKAPSQNDDKAASRSRENITWTTIAEDFGKSLVQSAVITPVWNGLGQLASGGNLPGVSIVNEGNAKASTADAWAQKIGGAIGMAVDFVALSRLKSGLFGSATEAAGFDNLAVGAKSWLTASEGAKLGAFYGAVLTPSDPNNNLVLGRLANAGSQALSFGLLSGGAEFLGAGKAFVGVKPGTWADAFSDMGIAGTVGMPAGVLGVAAESTLSGRPLKTDDMKQAAIDYGLMGFAFSGITHGITALKSAKTDKVVSSQEQQTEGTSATTAPATAFREVPRDSIPSRPSPWVNETRLATGETQYEHVFGATVIKGRADGSEVWIDPASEMTVTRFSGGSERIDTKAGSTIVLNRAGEILSSQSGQGERVSAGQMMGGVDIERPDGVVVRYYGSNSIDSVAHNGRNTFISYPGGKTVHFAPDQLSRSTKLPVGTRISESADSDLYFDATYPDGSTESRYRYSGTVSIKHANGVTEARLADRTTLLIDRDGNRTTVLEDGTRVHQSAKGSAATIEHPNGNTETAGSATRFSTLADGTVIVENRPGVPEIVLSDISKLIPEELRPEPFVTSNVSDHFASRMKTAYLGISSAIRAALAEHGFQVGIVDKSINDVPFSRQMETPRGYSEGSTEEQVPGFAQNDMAGARRAVVAEMVRDRRSFEWRSVSDPEHTLWHEVGHDLDLVFGKDGKHYTQSPEFLEAYAADVASPDVANNRSALSYYLQDGATGPSEALAEAVATVKNRQGSGSEMFEKAFPNVIRLVERKLAELESAPASAPNRLADILRDPAKADSSMAYLNAVTYSQPELMVRLDPYLQRENIDNLARTVRSSMTKQHLSELLGRRINQNPDALRWLPEAASQAGPLGDLSVKALISADTPMARDVITKVMSEQLESQDPAHQESGIQTFRDLVNQVHQKDGAKEILLAQKQRLSNLASNGQTEAIRSDAAWQLDTLRRLVEYSLI